MLTSRSRNIFGLWLLALVVIDAVSSFFGPCIGDGTSAEIRHYGYQQAECDQAGLIVAGLAWLWELKPEVWTAVATVAIAAFTLTLWLTGERQLTQVRRTVDLARDEFLASHRPKMIVRVEHMERLLPNEPITATFRVTNVGDSTATVTEFRARIQARGRSTLLIAPLQYPVIQLPKVVFANGESESYTLGSQEPVSLTDLIDIRSIPAVGHERLQVCLYGRIIYRDELGISRRTGFFRIYEPEMGHFRLSENPDHEYQD